MASYDDLVAQIKQMSASGGDPNSTMSNGRYNRNANMELSRLLDVLENQRKQIMGDIRGVQPNVTQQDIELMQKLQQATLTPGLAQISGNAGARGLTGSSIEGVQRGQFAAQTALGSQEQLQNMAFTRANNELNRQQILFNTLVGSVQPQFAMTQGTRPNQKPHGGVLNRLGRGALGAGLGFLTSGMNPMGAVAGGAAGVMGGSPQDYQMQQQPQPMGPMINPWDNDIPWGY